MIIFSVHLHSFAILTVIVAQCYGYGVVKRGLPDGSVVGKCPENWHNEFCSCDVNLNTLSITIHCSFIEKGEQLKDSLKQGFGNKRFEWFLLENSQVEELPDGIFNELSFVGFIANHNRFGKIGDYAFKDSEDSALYIWMSDNKFPSGFNFKSLQVLKNLISIVILSSQTPLQIPDEPFKSLSHLETINLERNKIDTLGKNVFSSLPKLRRIDLSWNNLTKIEKHAFNTSGCEKPISLSLVHNQISEIEDNAFEDVNANYISLQYNNLKSLKRSAFEPLLDSMSKLKNAKVFLQGNPFVCDSSFDWLADKPKKYRQQLRGVPCLQDKSQ